MEQKKVYSLMVLTAFFWASAFIAGKFGVEEFSPVSITFFRFLFATIIIFSLMVKWEKKDWHIKKGDWKAVILLGLVGMVGYHILFFSSLIYTTTTNSSIIAACNPLITSILAAIFAGEVLGFKRLGALSIALVGVILTITNWDLAVMSSLSFNKGDLLMLGAVLCMAIYSVMAKKIMPKYSPLILTTYSFLVCTVVLFPFVLVERPLSSWAEISWQGWAAVVYMSIFPTVIGYLIQQISIKAIGASRTNIFINLVPVFSIILAVLILKEELIPLKLVSAGIIILGVYLNSTVKEEKRQLKDEQAFVKR